MKNAKRLNNLMKKESEIISLCNRDINNFKSKICNKDFTGLNDAVADLKDYGLQIEELDRERDLVFRTLKEELNVDKKAGFFETAVKLPEEFREISCNEFRKLKLNLSTFQSSMLVIENLVRTAENMIQYVIKQGRRSVDSGSYSSAVKGYGSFGSAGNPGPMVLNRTL
jgi:hypothetical protein